ncbi:hypothetical protein B0H13DRAFT_1851402 [Mycena leptocephala]|nr:hypothetical protein B0H13DRAFT_1851402 [Mycena leptocephala]
MRICGQEKATSGKFLYHPVNLQSAPEFSVVEPHLQAALSSLFCCLKARRIKLKFENASRIEMRSVADINMSLLNRAIAELRGIFRQPQIQSFKPRSVLNGSYVLCHLCDSAVRKNAFQSIPLRSYANGFWIGDIPTELQDLTFLEAQCIARARATKCARALEVDHGAKSPEEAPLPKPRA